MLLSTPLRTLRFPLVALLLFFSVDGLLSQIVDQWDATSEIGGRFYYLTLPDTTDNTQDSRHTSGRLGDPESFALLVYSPVAQQVRIGRSGSSGMPVSVEAGEMVELDLRSLSVPMNTTRNTPSRDVIKVESAEPIILYVYMSNHFGVAAYTPLPVEAWGREYFVAVWPSDYVRNVYPAGEWDYDATEKKSSPSFITIVAAYDSTEVRIEPTDSLVHCDGCTTITLDRGQSYMVQSFTDTALASGDRTQPDLAGTRVTANRPIGLMSGNTRTNIEGPVAPALAGNAVKDLVVEWIRPIGLHGTEYVQMPMLDGRHPRQEFDAERQREAEIVRLVASSAIPSGGVMIGAGGTLAIEGGKQIDTGAFLEQRLALTDRVEAHLFRTEEPMQAFQAPKGIIAFRGTTGSGQFLGAAYDTWGTSLVEMMPRERWSSFAPFRTPSVPATTKHFVNVVTEAEDSSHITIVTPDGPYPFVMNQGAIPGTDLVWGSLPLESAKSYRLEANDSITFSGFVYGVDPGYELHLPGGIDTHDKGRDAAALHPSQYEEIIAEAYAFPLPGDHKASIRMDGYQVTEEWGECGELTLVIEALGNTPGYFTHNFVEGALGRNARIGSVEFSMPDSSFHGVHPRRAEIHIERVMLIDQSTESTLTLEWLGHGRFAIPQSFRYHFDAPRLRPTLPGLRLESTRGWSDTTVSLVNDSDSTILVERIVPQSTTNFEITGTVPSTDWEDSTVVLPVAPGDSVDLLLRYRGPLDSAEQNALLVEYSCMTRDLAIEITLINVFVADPRCAMVTDLDFGTMLIGRNKTLSLTLCNRGEEIVHFVDSSTSGGGAVITWLDDSFTMTKSVFDRLRRSSLGPDECVGGRVTFHADDTVGSYKTVARLWLNTRRCRDTSIWSVNVVDSARLSAPENHTPTPGLDLADITLDRNGILGFGLFSSEKGEATLRLYDAEGRRVLVRQLGIVRSGASRFEQSIGSLPPGAYILEIDVDRASVARHPILLL